MRVYYRRLPMQERIMSGCSQLFVSECPYTDNQKIGIFLYYRHADARSYLNDRTDSNAFRRPSFSHADTCTGGANLTVDSFYDANKEAKPTFVVSGISDPNAEISLEISPDIIVKTTTADSTGSWSIQIDPALKNGDKTMTVTAVNADGGTTFKTFMFSVKSGTSFMTNAMIIIILAVIGAIGYLIYTKKRKQTPQIPPVQPMVPPTTPVQPPEQTQPPQQPTQ